MQCASLSSPLRVVMGTIDPGQVSTLYFVSLHVCSARATTDTIRFVVFPLCGNSHNPRLHNQYGFYEPGKPNLCIRLIGDQVWEVVTAAQRTRMKQGPRCENAIGTSSRAYREGRSMFWSFGVLAPRSDTLTASTSQSKCRFFPATEVILVGSILHFTVLSAILIM